MEDYFKYTDENDKSYGIAGMAIALLTTDSEDMLASVSLEPDDNSFEMSGEFFFATSPRMSAKLAWRDILRQYQVGGNMLLGNVLCRHYASTISLDDTKLAAIHDFMVEEGARWCELEADEVDSIYNDRYDYYRQLFRHPRIAAAARDFASVLRSRRSMSAAEVIETLRRLTM
ncbi:MAG: hypothetical protein K2M61_04050 [Muribaculaceae bacterium]|nr:hypothetical protein [Muribaculaceae bacterium]